MSLGLLITYFNEKELLTRSLLSITGEKNPPKEILVYDDCSEFNAESFVPAHLKGTVKIFRGTKNRGPAYGRNFLLKNSTATYVKFHDTDDELKPGWSEKIDHKIATENPDVILFEVDGVHAEGQRFERTIGLWEIRKGRDPVSFAIQHAIVTSSAVYRRAFLATTGAYREDLWQSEDHEFHIRVLNHSPRVSIIEESLLDLHVREQSRSQKFQEVWRCRLQGLKFAKEYLSPGYLQDLCDAAADVGSILYQMGDTEGAALSFEWARSISTPRYRSRPWFYRAIAKHDPLLAESIGRMYRNWVPDFVRRVLH